MDSPAMAPGGRARGQAEGPNRPAPRAPDDRAPVAPVATTPAATTPEQARDHVLDRGLNLGAVPAALVVAAVVVGVAIALRLAALDVFALGPDEAERAYDAYALLRGRPLGPGEELGTVGPLFLLLQALGLFLFGATDATARLAPALLGLAMLPLALALRPFVGRAAALGMAGLLAISPTLVYASRTADPEVGVACFSLLLVVAVLRAGLPHAPAAAVRRWATVAGIAVGAMLACGPTAITVLLGLAAAAAAALTFDRSPRPAAHDDDSADDSADDRRDTVAAPPNAARSAFEALTSTPGALPAAALGLLATLLVLFTRLFSDLDAISGIASTFADWGGLLANDASTTPTQFFLLSILLYEILAVVFAVVAGLNATDAAARSEDGAGGLGWAFFAAWFGAALLLFAFSSGRAPEQAVHVALPLALLGGMGLGNVLGAIDWRDALKGPGALLYLAVLGMVIGVIGVAILAGRVDTAPARTAAAFQVGIVAVVVVGGLAAFAATLARTEELEGRTGQSGRIALLVALTLLGVVTLRSTMNLNFYNADSGNELLAQRTPTGAVKPLVGRLQRLSRDVSVTRSSIRDPFGTYGLTVALDQRVAWPFRWYLRDFPDVTVAAEGQAPAQGAEVVIAPDDAGMAEAGYTPQASLFLNRVPAAYESPDTGGIALGVLSPGRWVDSFRYLLFRDLDQPAEPETLAIGYNRDLADRLFPDVASAPENLFALTGPGSGRGELNGPRGVGTSPDGATIYVVDALNARVQRYDAGGGYIGTWGADDDANGLQFGRFINEESGATVFGPSGLDVADDGIVYVADTWNHRVVGISPTGQPVREIGQPGQQTDIGDDPAQVLAAPGLFFGPRGVAVANDEIYVTDTGNERVQVFGLDGTFRRAWGGFGSAANQLIEPVGIAVGDDGVVYVADSGNGRIGLFAPDGTPLEQWPVEAWAATTYDQTGVRPGFEPDLAFGPDGLLYATSRETGSIEVLGPGGRPLASVRELGGEPLVAPVGLAFAPDGSLLVTEPDQGRVLAGSPPDASALLPGDEPPTIAPTAADAPASPSAPVEEPPTDAPAPSPTAAERPTDPPAPTATAGSALPTQPPLPAPPGA